MMLLYMCTLFHQDSNPHLWNNNLSSHQDFIVFHHKESSLSVLCFLNHLFDELRMMNVEFAMRVSYLELYNEELCDLLSTDDTVKIRIIRIVHLKHS